MRIPSYYWRMKLVWPWELIRAEKAYKKEYKQLIEPLKPDIERLKSEYYPKCGPIPFMLWTIAIEAPIVLGAMWGLSYIFPWLCNPDAILQIFCH